MEHVSLEMDLPSRPESRGQDVQEGPLWKSISSQLFKPEVSYIKRRVGESLIQKNKLMWDEISSLRQMLAEFQEQNDVISAASQKQAQFCGTQHRDLLKRQAHIILEDLRSQAASCGFVVEDLVPELRDDNMRNFLFGKASSRPPSACGREYCHPSPPPTPSTRPSSSSGYSGCSSPESFVGIPQMALGGRQMSLEEMQSVAAGIREALEAEHESLLAAISEQMQRLEAEELRRSESKGRAANGPSTAGLQQFVHKLQELAVSPSLRTLSLTSQSPLEGTVSASPIVGGASVRRLQALIAIRRRPLGVVPEASDAASLPSPGQSKAAFDPFFDDPFA